MSAPAASEPWKAAGSSRGPGIPAPSGQYRVGCVDLMCQLEGDDKGLLVRLHYPTEATAQQGYQYSNWHPHRNYIRGFLDFANVKFTGDLSKFISTLNNSSDNSNGVTAEFFFQFHRFQLCNMHLYTSKVKLNLLERERECACKKVYN